MTVLVSAASAEALHDPALTPGEIAGPAQDKSPDRALARVENRLAYGMVKDACHLAALYAKVVARGHCFDDGTKRTAFETMNVCLHLHGIAGPWTGTKVTDRIIALARGDLDAETLAHWLRGL